MFKYEIVWQKSRKVGFLQAKNQPLKQTEYVYVFKKTKGCYNPQMSIGKPYKTKGNKANDDYLYENRLKEFKATDNKGIRYPTNIVKFNNPSKSVHPTQKPVDLCEYLVKTYSNEGELVLDFTMGSGSTGVACKNTGRRFIGVEREEKYFEVAKERLRF
jgi:site-specific DNA-methyltransferase (adenine-specific)